ncbi:MAG: hypothetical protein IPI38_15765 [Gemmatimonadetes bacterium]|nr:hypothetical protein [Gemmatimonadota bacterium]MBK6780020.1 hypothetical protein [Gemmatimonadota bacterium]MBK7716857.1 hypothetical protein [Gemmatimonadota bacterium]MBK7922289.1 hypothetical protein [Gemmatimonadota bacterium]MBK9067014.1 hypothetical protein [Gemmatimonadota bacterium]
MLTSGVRAQVPSAEAQIAGAVSAAPEGLRAAATVLGYRNYHRMDILRQGTNGIICLADDPSVERWQTSCYHQDLEPFMRRGRELRDLGLSHAQIDSARQAEVDAGILKMPDGPRALFNLYAPADSVDQATGLARGTSRLEVVYTPYATSETTGLPTRPGNGLPWLMYPGKPWAHIMIMH